MLDRRADRGRRLHVVRPRVDDAHAELLAAERHEITGTRGRVLEHELRDVEAREIRRQMVVE